ncbi:MAG: hypothetical protein LBV27_10860 [Oscillospiraceae bacterium]|jgi:acyl-ACP thioesterase|nr:hypothetical protein [Oscillospiraceae bacterium]
MLFTKDMVAFDYDCDSAQRLKISAAMRYMQQTSAEHLNHLGLPYEKLYRENMVFLLSKSCIKIFDMPVAGEEIVVGTAAVATRGARFVREFVIDDPKGNRMLSAFTLWILVDPNTRRILRPQSFPYDLTFQQEAATQGEIADIALPKDADPDIGVLTDLSIRYSHIDCNGHVNNSFYADFVCDALPVESLLSKGLDTIVLSYHNEAKWGDVITMRTNAQSGNGYYVRGGKKDGSPCFEALAVLKESAAEREVKRWISTKAY